MSEGAQPHVGSVSLATVGAGQGLGAKPLSPPAGPAR
jgi:hypothetical protein